MLDGGERSAQPDNVPLFLENAEDHSRQERRLRAREVIGSVRVEDEAVILDLVNEVLDHVARKSRLAIAQQPNLDEVTVPPVHLVEATAGHDVRGWKVEEAGRG